MGNDAISRALLFAALFVAGRFASWFVYQICWSNGLTRRLHRLGAAATLLARPWLWLVHVPIVALSSNLTWDELPALRWFAVVANVLLVVGAVGRFGVADLHRFFLLDRIIAVGMAVGVWFSPGFLYASILVCGALQYTISGWRLNPGYSNLLGFEFIRATCCVLAVGLALGGLLLAFDRSLDGLEALVFAVVLAFQGSLYVNNALAKAALGDRSYAWVTKNRLQCLVVNSYLRGWGAKWVGPAFILKLAAAIGRMRVLLCAAAFFLELGFVFVLADARVAIGLLLGAAVFHVIVFVLTGLLEVEYVVNHVTLGALIAYGSLAGAFTSSYWAAAILCMAFALAWIAFIRTRVADEYQRTGAAVRFGKLGDAADLLMAWWDSPYMRMYSYTAETVSGRHVAIPVTRLSPYDTALTDIHTHIMLLHAHAGLDTEVEHDRQVVRCGVWGLVRTPAERDELYRLMDVSSPDLERFRSLSTATPWEYSPTTNQPSAAAPMRDLFNGINEYQPYRWFRLAMRWPHFPGEDLVPDVCPLVDAGDGMYACEEPMLAVTMWRVKTFYTGREIIVIEHQPVGTIRLDSAARKT